MDPKVWGYSAQEEKQQPKTELQRMSRVVSGCKSGLWLGTSLGRMA